MKKKIKKIAKAKTKTAVKITKKRAPSARRNSEQRVSHGSPQKAYETLLNRERERAVLESIDYLLGWDESVYMPEGGAWIRGEQKALLAKQSHAMMVHPEVGESLSVLIDSSWKKNDVGVQANLREIQRAYHRAKKIPASWYEAIAKATTEGRTAWIEARKKSDFKIFKPVLKKIIDLKKQEAKCLTKGPLYDALLDYHEPGANWKELSVLFAQLKKELTPMVEALVNAPHQPKKEILHQRFPIADQRKFGEAAVRAIGFNFENGRLDDTVHPFCLGVHPKDVRITTRYYEDFFNPAFFGMMHEAGHGLYEQGLNPEHYGSPLGRFCSFGIHESQSRLWENGVGRSPAFWKHFFPLAQKAFPGALATIKYDEFVHAVNLVEKSLIRVEADEVTYNLHIIIRAEIESALLEGDLSLDDVPSAWNQAMKKSLGITPKNDAEGCLQDVHWSMGGFGYFPTYTMGNLYAAQFMEAAEKDLGALAPQFEKGQFSRLHDWLKKNIYERGQMYAPLELCKVVTGRPLSIDPLIDSLNRKIKPLYRL
jgi:carboxypeptidase Taq